MNGEICVVFFFQAEDGIRDYKVTGVQTCALPIFPEGQREPARAARVHAGRGLQRADCAGGCCSGSPDGEDRPEEVACAISLPQLLSSPLPSWISGSTASKGLRIPSARAPAPFSASLRTSRETFGCENVPAM